MIRRLNFGSNSFNCTLLRGLLVIFVSLFTCFLFSHSAYAGTSISIANTGETITFSKVQPSSSGTVTTASDTLTITTDCSAGYNVYISGINGGSTSLVNNAANSNNEISALSGTTIGTTALALQNNTWGFNTVNSDTYYGLPNFVNATDHAIYSGTNTNVPIYYGAKVTNALAPGKYSGQVLYTAMVNSSCLNYTVIFNKNAGDATGTMSNQPVPPSTATPLTVNTFERPGYAFLGWSTNQNATAPTYTDGQSVTNLAASGSSITLYAIWGRTMQGFAEDFGCTTIVTGSTIDLYDARDNSKYTVKRFSDGSCWMIQNLHIGYDKPYTLTKNDTNISDNGSYYLPQAGKQANLDGTSVADANFSTSSDNQARVQYASADTMLSKRPSLANAQDTGYYNFYAATLGKSYKGLDGIVSGYIEKDICPKGWQLPVNDSNDHHSWSYFYGTLNSGQYANMLSTNGAALLYSGYYNGSSLSGIGSYTYVWSSTVYNADGSYYLSMNSDTVYPVTSWYKERGFAVRCVAKTINATGWMQNFDQSTLPAGQTVTLADKRDYSEYTVKKFSDGSVWMTQNLRLGHDKAYTLTKDLTNISDNGSYYLPQAGNRAPLNASSSAGSTTFNGNYDDQSQVQYSQDKNTGYYNFYAATLGKSYYGLNGTTANYIERDICPKGWQLPVNDSSSTKSWYYFYNILNNVSQSIMMSTDGASLSYVGYYDAGSLQHPNARSGWRTSTVYDSSYGYYLHMESNYVAPQGTYYKYAGFSVRCVAKAISTDYMQDFDCSSLASGGTATLIDKRDSQGYSIYRIPTDSAATRLAGKCLMTKDLRLGMVTSGEITAGTNLTLNTNTSAGAGTINYGLSSSDVYAKQYSYPSSPNNYTNHGYYSLYAADIICPKGWRLPSYDEFMSRSGGLRVVLGSGSGLSASSALIAAPYLFVAGGYNTGAASGSLGYYWVTPRSNSSGQYYTIHFGDNNTSTGSGFNDYYLNNTPYYGESVRCVAD
ncbi:InlB B-repeat-containing protein [Candidatus Saccharibacteria bacterium]|nr:InlB B-repeat-containing protein [Candidatus Saccharibacteria bacterium]